MIFPNRFFNLKVAKDFFKILFRIPLDIKIALSIFTIGMVVGAIFISTSPIIPFFYQQYFGPAVMSACGRGYVQPELSQVPKLSNFLSVPADVPSLKKARFSCSDLPKNLKTSKPDKFAGVHRYLMETVALFWSISGVSWSALTPLYGIFYGTTVAISYGLFRLGMGRVLASLGALLLILSKAHLENLPHVRDYSKAPFILALVLITGYVVKQSPKPSTLFGLSAACGTILGIGLGFRADLLIYVPVFVAVLFLFLSTRVLMSTRLKSTVVFFTCLFITAFPILLSRSGGGNTFHVILLGFMSQFDLDLSVKNSLYKWGDLYKDGLVWTQINSYSNRIHYNNSFLPIATREYERFGLLYFKQIVSNFPADMLTRVYAAIIKILEFPFDNQNLNLLSLFQEKVDFSDKVYLGIFSFFKDKVVLLTVSALSILSIYSWRIAIFLLLFVIYLSGYPALQFQSRHYFHLEFISLWVIGFFLQLIIQRLVLISRGFNLKSKFFPNFWDISVKRPLCFILGTLIFLLSPLYALRGYQNNHIGSLFKSYVTADTEEIQINPTLINNSIPGNNKIILKNSSLFARQPSNFPVRTEYLVVDFGGNKCDQQNIPVTFRYRSGVPSYDFSTDMNISVPEKSSKTTTKMFFPVYAAFPFASNNGWVFPPIAFEKWQPFLTANNEWAAFHFEGIELLEQHTSCVSSLRRFKDINHYPLLLNLTLLPNWEKVARYQTIRKQVKGS
jgi:hypothetical protein